MRTMKKLMVVASLVFAFGCGKKGMDGKLDELAGIKDKMCECKDKACTEKVHEDYITWKKGNSKDEKPNKDQMDKFEQLRAGMNLCRHKVEGDAGGADSAPPAPGATPPAAPTETK
ncbi:MAG: hypothetical protein JWO36_1903 [Myxococcales bacterium]|nr:hypothetical protein [Myxococcales bacterium]